MLKVPTHFCRKSIVYLPTTMEKLREKFTKYSRSRLAKRLVRFGIVLRHTCIFEQRGLCDLIHQIGCPNIFFTLTAMNTIGSGQIFIT